MSSFDGTPTGPVVPHRRRAPSIAVRLAGAFASVLLLFLAGMVVVIVALDRIDTAEALVAKMDRAKHAGHMVAAQIRDQYVHQVHMIINWDFSHLDHYDEVVRNRRGAAEALSRLAQTSEERRLADEIARLSEANDDEFRARVIPAIGGAAPESLAVLHEDTEREISAIVVLTDELNGLFEERSASALEGAVEIRDRARIIVLVCFGLALVLAALVAVLMTRFILSRVAVLRSGALRVAEGDLTVQIEIQGADELAELAATFNQMTRDLARHQSDRLRSQKLAAIGQVAAGVAHEINNPLSVILGYVKLLQKSAEDTALDDLAIIEDEALQCQRIVQDLLDLARPQQLDRSKIDLGQTAVEALQRLKTGGQLEGIEVDAPPESAEPVLAWADEVKVRQVIYNVLLNAAEATSSGGRIVIRVEREAQEAVLSVTDTGAGVSDEMLTHMFEPFVTSKADGAGLGLAISRAIVDALGGEIRIESEVEKGTQVMLRLPLNEASVEEVR